MEYVECRTHDTICIGERIRLTVLERQRDSVTLAVVAAPHSHVRFARDPVQGEPVDAAHTLYRLPLLTGDSFTVDDIRVDVGVYLDRHEIAANDDCDIQLQISRMQGAAATGHASAQRLGAKSVVSGYGHLALGLQTPRPSTAEHENGMQIRCLRGAGTIADARQDHGREGACLP